MGRRYQAILKSLGHEFYTSDIETHEDAVIGYAHMSDGIIIASPTETHHYFIHLLAPLSIPILCEKPICKSEDALTDIIEICEANKTRLTMMMQYYTLTVQGDAGSSSYDYFRTGPDGLPWDCFQIIALSHGEVKINNQSPVWTCSINGRKLNLGDMDKAYVNFVRSWVNGYAQTSKELIEMHRKVINFGLRK